MRAAEDRHGQVKTTALTAGQGLHANVRAASEVHQLKDLGHGARTGQGPRPHAQRLGDREGLGEAGLLKHDPHAGADEGPVAHRVAAQDADRARCGGGDALDDLDQGGLAGAVDAEDRDELPARDRETDSRDGGEGATPLAPLAIGARHIGGLDDGHVVLLGPMLLNGFRLSRIPGRRY